MDKLLKSPNCPHIECVILIVVALLAIGAEELGPCEADIVLGGTPIAVAS